MFIINNTLESIFGLSNTTAARAWNRLIKEDASEIKQKNESFIGEIGNLVFSRTIGSETMNIKTINE
ncbi:hypothetical protein GHO45_11110 [Pseudomonas sp. FSL R10-0765]|uniref:hypothetical protein n=1 Tax=Pseudomonas sp. FSL R10-0765 TaxID=2662195 RepID=UPI001294C017|nr:hypothetical protein [Pseudomonas sp. FSL R10-0765]MQT41473.1 hypothetical protein [Pseudomonas sp. FSL R10-0765]